MGSNHTAHTGHCTTCTLHTPARHTRYQWVLSEPRALPPTTMHQRSPTHHRCRGLSPKAGARNPRNPAHQRCRGPTKGFDMSINGCTCPIAATPGTNGSNRFPMPYAPTAPEEPNKSEMQGPLLAKSRHTEPEEPSTSEMQGFPQRALARQFTAALAEMRLSDRQQLKIFANLREKATFLSANAKHNFVIVAVHTHWLSPDIHR